MIGATFCSGIGAPEVAAPWVDWQLASEIEAFPREVLRQRFGHRDARTATTGPRLWPDMTTLKARHLRRMNIELPDLIVAGTPCQSFSIAGLRQGTADARGNLTMKFVEICHAIHNARDDGKLAVLWENVPGILSDRGNAFGCFLGGIVGAVDPVLPSAQPKPGASTEFWKWIPEGQIEIRDEKGEPTGEFTTTEAHHRVRWPSEGMVQGPRARAAWAILDAQWRGVAQRRRRLFVVVDFGNCVDPAAVLLEPDRLRGNTPPRRETGQVAFTHPSRSTGGGGLGTDFDCDGWMISDCTPTLRAGGNATGGDRPPGTDVDTCETLIPHVANPLTARMHKGINTTMDEGQTPIPVANSLVHANAGGQVAVGFAQNQRGEIRESDVALQLNTGGGKPGQGYPAVREGYAVRRLTPTECARLQGFPDDHCAITYRGRPAADGPQYRAYGNSMAVPVVRYILERMTRSREELSEAKATTKGTE